MAPQPKRKHSNRRGRVRTMVLERRAAQLIACPSCKNLRIPHRVCPHCGFYDGRVVLKHENTK